MAHSVFASIVRLSSRLPCALAGASPVTRCWIIERSNSAKAPVTWKKELSGWGGRVDVLLLEVNVDRNRFEVFYRLEEVAKRAAHKANGPCHHHIELAVVCVLQHLVEAGTLV